MAIKEDSRLWTRILNAVSKDISAGSGSSQELLESTKEKMRNYSGKEFILENFLEIAETDNPYLATRQSRIVEARWKTPADEKALMKEQKLPAHGRSLSGHRLYNQFFAVLLKYGAEPVLFGAEAITAIYQVWGSKEQANKFSPDFELEANQQRKIRERKSISTLGQDLESFLNNPSSIDDVTSTYARADLRKILHLDDEIRKRLMLLDNLINSDVQLYNPNSRNYVFSDDPDGGLWKWFEKEKGIPDEIMSMYKTYRSAAVDISDTDRDKLRTALILYSARNRRVSTNAILAGAEIDLNFYLSLPKDHELRKNLDEPKLYRVRDKLQKPEITLLEACEVLEIFDFVKMREMINGELYKTFKAELKHFLNLTRPLYVDENGQMKKDSIGSSVPWGRIKETEFGQAHVREDHEFIKEFHRLEILTGHTERLLKSINVKQFDDFMTQLVTSKRKFDYWSQWKKYGISQARSRDFTITENFEAEYGFTIDEFVKRAEFLKNKSTDQKDNLKGGGSQLKDKAKFGLYSKNIIGGLSDIIQSTKNLTPYDRRLTALYRENRELLNNPLILANYSGVYESSAYINLDGNPAYVTQAQKKGIDSLPLLKEYLNEKKELSDGMDRITKAKYFNLVDVSRFGISDSRYVSRPAEGENIYGVNVMTNAEAEQRIREIAANYTPFSQVPDFKNKAFAVFGFQYEEKLHSEVNKAVFFRTWHRIKEIDENALIGNALIAKVNELHSKMFGK